MTVKELWAEYQHYTGSLTEHARKLGFAGAAICWLFKDADHTFPFLIYCALLGFVAFFVCDLMQYFCGALCIRFFTESQESKLVTAGKSFDESIDKPRWLDWPALALFVLKCIALAAGFVLIGVELLLRLSGRHTV